MKTEDIIDLHMHIGPEPIPRKFNISKLIKQETGKMKAIAIKNHFYPTTNLIEKSDKNLLLIGSITLNNYVGGLNPDCIYASARISNPMIVWFPTINAENFLRKSKYEIPEEWGVKNPRLSKSIKKIKILDNKGNLLRKTKKVLEAIKENNCILATGHISYQESEKLVKEAIRIGIKKIIITHPVYQKINMPIRLQIKLSKYKEVYIEECFAMYFIDKIPIEKIARQIKSIGAKKCILTSDVGQNNSPSPSKAINLFAKLLIKQGITQSEINKMTIVNPRKILGLKETLINNRDLTKQKETNPK